MLARPTHMRHMYASVIPYIARIEHAATIYRLVEDRETQSRERTAASRTRHCVTIKPTTNNNNTHELK